MQVFQPRTTRAGSRLSIVTGGTIGLLLVGLGAALAYLALATPFSQQFIPEPRASGIRVVVSALGWTLLIAAPATAAIAGIAWLADVAGRASLLRAKPHPVVGLARVLGEDYTAATNVRLPDGRVVSEIIVGPHGMAVFEPMPPAAITRMQGGRWELRVGKDRWIPLENPLERTVRSADRVRHWLANEDRGFVVRVHAAIVASDAASIGRSPGCAVVSREQIPAYLNSLPVQRGFTPERRAQIVEIIRAAV
ncbi:MAG: NERD domain-containing protein [Chloroflexota bacterium]|nr:NERD domain-containing protein [Chloroflexota bacterium]